MEEPTPLPTSSKKRQPWRPTKHLLPSQPPRDEQIKEEIYNNSVAAAEQWGGALDFAGRAPKRLKPRRTVDYMAGAARWQTVSPKVVESEAVGFEMAHAGCTRSLLAAETSVRTTSTPRRIPWSIQHVQCKPRDPSLVPVQTDLFL